MLLVLHDNLSIVPCLQSLFLLLYSYADVGQMRVGPQRFTWCGLSERLLQAPAGVVLGGRLELPYAAPYIPPPSLPPPEYAHLQKPMPWQPGRKRAVLVAVNYSSCPHPHVHLRGCVNDIHCLRHLLMMKFGCAKPIHDSAESCRRIVWPCLRVLRSPAFDALLWAALQHGACHGAGSSQIALSFFMISSHMKTISPQR
jgi:hypothetical protein